MCPENTNTGRYCPPRLTLLTLQALQATCAADWFADCTDCMQPRRQFSCHGCVATNTFICGLSHSPALSTNGCILCWGDGSRGQLGLGPNVLKENDPRIVEFDFGAPVLRIQVSRHASFAITQDGRVFGWFASMLTCAYSPTHHQGRHEQVLPLRERCQCADTVVEPREPPSTPSSFDGFTLSRCHYRCTGVSLRLLGPDCSITTARYSRAETERGILSTRCFWC
jgi:hypothetical protein